MRSKLFSTSGFREFENGLLELATKDARRIGRRGVRKAAEPIHEAYQAGVTVKSGTLEENVNIGNRLNKRQRAMTPRPGPSEIEIHVGTADPAGIQEELGIRQPANPALTRAWDEHGDERALKIIGDELGAGLEREAKRKKKG